MTQQELLHRLWVAAEAWRQRKVRNADSLDWWLPDEAKMVDVLDDLKECAVREAQAKI